MVLEAGVGANNQMKALTLTVWIVKSIFGKG